MIVVAEVPTAEPVAAAGVRVADSSDDRALRRCGCPHARQPRLRERDIAPSRRAGATRGHAGAEAALVGHSQSPQHKNPEQRHVARPPREATENMPLRKRRAWTRTLRVFAHTRKHEAQSNSAGPLIGVFSRIGATWTPAHVSCRSFARDRERPARCTANSARRRTP
jgi:hypothetical protein